MKHQDTTFTKCTGTAVRIPGGHLLCIGALCLGVIFTDSATADSAETNLTLQVVLDIGDQNNPQLQAAYSRWKAEERNIAVQRALPDPMFTYGYYFDSVETRVGPQEQRFGLSQRFPGFGKLSSLEAIAHEAAKAAEQRYRTQQLQLHQAIVKAYGELYYLKRNIAIAQDRIQLIRDLEKVATTRYKAGAPLAPTMQAQVELGRLEDRIKSLQDMLQPAEARLNALLNRPSNAPLSIAGALPYRAIDSDTQAMMKQLIRTSPELMELDAKIQQSGQHLKLARRQRLPDFTLGIQYIDTGEASMAVSDSGKDPIIGTVGITLPIWLSKNRARIESAVHQQAAAQLMLENRTQTLEAEIQQALFTLRDADRKINLYRDSLVPKAKQSLEVNRQGYEAGQMEFINLIDAERMLLEFELAYERAMTDHLIARAELSKLTGVDFLKGDIHETH